MTGLACEARVAVAPASRAVPIDPNRSRRFFASECSRGTAEKRLKSKYRFNGCDPGSSLARRIGYGALRIVGANAYAGWRNSVAV